MLQPLFDIDYFELFAMLQGKQQSLNCRQLPSNKTEEIALVIGLLTIQTREYKTQLATEQGYHFHDKLIWVWKCSTTTNVSERN